MNCHLTDKDRSTGNRCRSWDCIPCKEFGLSHNDATIINIHMDNMRLKEENKKLREDLNWATKELSNPTGWRNSEHHSKEIRTRHGLDKEAL